MFNTLRKFFGKRVEETVEPSGETVPATQPFSPSPAVSPARPDAQSRPMRVEVSRPVAPTASALSLPLRSVLGRLPAELTARVRQMDVGDVEVVIPMQKVLTQLPQGAVRITYGELRQASPPGTFTPEGDRDKMLIELPLHEILARVNPASLARRAVQKHVEVPPEVTGPFGGQNRVTITTEPLRGAVPPSRGLASGDTAFRRVNLPMAQPKPEPAPGENLFKRNGQNGQNGQSSAPSPGLGMPPEENIFQRAGVPPAQPKPEPLPEENIFKRASVPPASSKPVLQPEENIFKRASVPSAQPKPEPLLEEDIFKRASASPAPASQLNYTPIPPAPAVPPPAAIPASAALRDLAASTPVPAAPQASPATHEPIRFNPASAPAPESSRGETTFLTASLLELSHEWPDPIREEIAHLNTPATLVGLPLGAVEIAIKRGKVAFPWRLIRSWIKPPLASAQASPHDAVVVELPLRVVTPIFMAHLRTTRPQKKVTLDENIPDLFSGGPGTEVIKASPTPVPPTPAPSTPDTNYYSFSDTGDAPEPSTMAATKAPSPGTSFLQRYATPNEIVSKAAALDGVGGSLIALPDGLLVASKIPKDLNGDTLAAFLPQIFGRVSQSTRELRMGELNNLNFTVGSIPWKIFRVGAIYFAAFGIAGQSLPTGPLAGIAAELDRKAK